MFFAEQKWEVARKQKIKRESDTIKPRYTFLVFSSEGIDKNNFMGCKLSWMRHMII